MSQTVARALEILELVSAHPRTQSEVAQVLGVHRSTALRLLETLVESGLVRRGADARYCVGYRLAGLGQLASEQFETTQVTRPHLAALSEMTGHTVHLAVLESTQIVYADKIEPPQTVRLYSQVGRPVRLHTTGVSKAILAFQPADLVNSMLDGYEFEKFTATTITTKSRFLSELVAVGERGWAVDDGEYEDYINCIAVPIRDFTGNVTGAVSVTALKARATIAQLEELIPDINATVRTISKELGWKD